MKGSTVRVIKPKKGERRMKKKHITVMTLTFLMMISALATTGLMTVNAEDPHAGSLTMHMLINTIDTDGQHAIALSIKQELAKIGITVLFDYRDDATISDTIESTGTHYNYTWDDVPNFLRSFLNQYAVDIVVGPYTFNEHTTRGPADKSFEEAAFLERLRNMLVMEEGDGLWLARATPRAWLAQGKRIAARNMPTHFGTVTYEIVSDVDNGRITATIALPARRPPKALLLRLRHPDAAPIKSIALNAQPWKDFDAAKEFVRLHDVKGTVRVEARY